MEETSNIQIDFRFNGKKPSFGDLFKIVGFDNPNFPSADNSFLEFPGLNIEQVDDYFGIRNQDEEGDDVILWIMPFVKDQEVFHHPGPFDGLRLQFDTLRNSTGKVAIVEKVFSAFQRHLDTTIIFENSVIDTFEKVRAAIDGKIKYWKRKGLEPGSDDALMYDEEE